MYAIVKTGGKQYKAEIGRFIDVEKLNAQVGEEMCIRDRATGVDAAQFLRKAAEMCQEKLGVKIHVYPILNDFFGHSITVTGLLTGRDIIRQLEGKELGEMCIRDRRYTEASLVKTLEELGIGRPSTYAPTISTILDREYVKKEKRALLPTELGEIVTDLMKKNFPDIVDIQFTADMEEKLDTVESEGKDWKGIVGDFYGPFEKELEKAEQSVEHVKIPDRPAGITCEFCGAEMVYKSGRFGEFIACPNYPTCKNTKAIKNIIKTPCPKCGGTVVQKRSKKGRIFYGCDNYPNCDFVSWDMPVEEKCPVCGSYMVLKRGRGTYKKCGNENCPSNQKKGKGQTKDEA